MDNITIKTFSENELSQLTGLMRMCSDTEFYIILDQNIMFYNATAMNGMSLCAVNDDDLLVGVLLCKYSNRDLENYMSHEVLQEIAEQGRLAYGIELANSCVHPDYRGHHLERDMIAKLIRDEKTKNLDAWFWATAHKDNIPSIKSITANGLEMILSDITMMYPAHVCFHRNLYIKK